MLRTHRLELPATLNRSNAIVGKYDLDGFEIEYDDETHVIDFRLGLGQDLAIFAALPAARNDRIRNILVDGAAFYVDEPELWDDPLLFDLPRLVWSGVLAEYVGGYKLTKVIFESSLAMGAYRFEAHVQDANGDVAVTVLSWASPEAPLAIPPPPEHDNPRVRDLMRAVYANPKSDDLRVVCADALLEINDPRGDASSFKSDDFLSKHRHQLLGGLANTVFIDEVQFKHGFIDRLVLQRPNKNPFFWQLEQLESPQRIVSAESEPKELATVRALDLSNLPIDAAHHIVARLPQSRMQALQEFVCRREHLFARAFHHPEHPDHAEIAKWLATHITKLVVQLPSDNDDENENENENEASDVATEARKYFPQLTVRTVEKTAKTRYPCPDVVLLMATATIKGSAHF